MSHFRVLLGRVRICRLIRPPSIGAAALCLVISLLGASTAIAEVPLTPVAPATVLPPFMKGSHLSGGAYNPGLYYPAGSTTPIQYGFQYIYPTTQEFDYYKSKGFSLIRLELDIARIQPKNLQPLNTTELSRITSLVEYARKTGMYIILDPHNYGQMWDSTNNKFATIGTEIPNYYFADFWSRFSTVYKNYPNVVYGLMNEPFIQTAAQWKTSAVAAINAIRAVTKTQTILIPGVFWSEAKAWMTAGNGAAWAGYKDPAGGPFMFEMHQYLNDDTSTRPTQCTSGMGSSLTDATTWLAANGYKAFLGEFGWPNVSGVVSPTCNTEGANLLNALHSHPGQWGGWDWCCSGPWAGNNHFNLDPGADGIVGDQPQIAIDPLRAPGV
jgi:endoglucanase